MTGHLVAMTDIFVSYAHEDKPQVERLVTALEHAGKRCWWDERIRAGTDFSKEIEEAINRASAAIVVWSQHAVGSRWVQAEASEALDQSKLVPVKIDNCRIPLEFRRIQTVDLKAWEGRHDTLEIRQILSGVGGIGRKDAREELRAWKAETPIFSWTGCRFTLTDGLAKHKVEYRNNIKDEAIFIDGVEVGRGGDMASLKPQFQFYLDDPSVSHLCVVKPVYGWFSRVFTVRLSGLELSVDGRMLPALMR